MMLSQEYLRQLAEVFIYYVLPADEGKSECLHFLIRELLTENVLGLAIDTFSDPDFIVNGIINARAFPTYFLSFFFFSKSYRVIQYYFCSFCFFSPRFYCPPLMCKDPLSRKSTFTLRLN